KKGGDRNPCLESSGLFLPVFGRGVLRFGGALTLLPHEPARRSEVLFIGRPHHDVSAAIIVGIIRRRVVQRATVVDRRTARRQFAGYSAAEIERAGLDLKTGRQRVVTNWTMGHDFDAM